MIVGVDVLGSTEDNTDAVATDLTMSALPGSMSGARVHGDSPGTWEISTSPRRRAVGGRGMVSPVGEEHPPIPREQEGASEVPPSEGNEARWDGRREVGASRCTDELGEPNRRDPREGRARRGAEPL
jgi:hypothetical protein